MEPFAQTINAAKKYVVSSASEQVDWNAELVRVGLLAALLSDHTHVSPRRSLFCRRR